jgi:hypothetical protein
MSETTITQTSQFVIEELSIITKKDQILDITAMYVEIDIFDSIYSPCIMGSILIQDSVNLSEKLLFDGSEVLRMKISKSENFVSIEKSFRIYKQSERKNISQTSESYILYFCSEELVLSEQMKLSKSFTTTYSQAALRVLYQYLGISSNSLGMFKDSEGIRKISMPTLTPLEAVRWCASKALDENLSPCFLFFENRDGYNFTSLNQIYSRPNVVNVNLTVKNIGGSTQFEHLRGVKHFEVKKQNNFLDNVKKGVYAGTFIGFDPLTKTITVENLNYADHYNTIPNHLNKSPLLTEIENRAGLKNTEMFNSKIVIHPFQTSRRDSDFVKTGDRESITFLEMSEKIKFQRSAIFDSLNARQIKMVLNGDFDITCGRSIGVFVPTRGYKSEDEDSYDKSLTGNYLITATRHILKAKNNMHEVVVEAVTDSTNSTMNKNAYYASSPMQTISG